MLIEVFSLGVQLRRYEWILIGNQCFWRGSSVSAKFSHGRGCPPANHFCTYR